MNDRFKFRVWAKPHEQTQTEGYYVDDADFMALFPDGNVEIDYYVDDGYAGRCEGFEQNEVIIEQCTGLKDKNGKPIYEGDIVKFNYKGEYVILKVIWYYGSFATTALDGDFKYPDWDKLEIIGNIHENPELLEQNDDDG